MSYIHDLEFVRDYHSMLNEPLAQCWERPGKILNTERVCDNTDSTFKR